MNERKDGTFPKDWNDYCLEQVQDLTHTQNVAYSLFPYIP